MEVERRAARISSAGSELAWRVEVTPAAERDLRSLDPHIRKQVVLDILRLEENPRPHGVEKMETKRSSIASTSGQGRTTASFTKFGMRFSSSSW